MPPETFPVTPADLATVATIATIATFAIRPVDPDDLPQWRTLWDGYNAFYGRSGDTALPEAITQLTWSRFLDPAEPMHALVAEEATPDGPRLLGLTHYLYHRSTTMTGYNCYLQDLFTVEAARGKGVGRALIEAVCQRVRAEGGERVYWQTHHANAPARRLYDVVASDSGFIVYRKLL